MLCIVADENIPLAREAFGGMGELRLLPGHAITATRVRDADVLLVRSVTRVDRALVTGSRLRFVGSATIGTDHVDVAALDAAGIAFHYAPGSNAESVVEYVLAALLTLAAQRGVALRGRTVGIIGCGRIGSELGVRLQALGMRVLRNDPPLAAQATHAGAAHAFVALGRILSDCDVVTLHVPLTRNGPWPTLHLIGARALARLRPDAWLVNTSRGAVVDGAALLPALERQQLAAAILDVWEHEPVPDPALIAACALATPHIAGYSWDGKVAGTLMLHDALVRALGVVSTWHGIDEPGELSQPRALLAPPLPASLDAVTEARWLHAVVQQLYDIEADDARMRALVQLPSEERAAAFREQRRAYPVRRTFRRHALARAAVPPAWRAALQDGLGLALADAGC